MVFQIWSQEGRSGLHLAPQSPNHVSHLSSAEPPEIVPFTFGKLILDEGDRAQVMCSVLRGDPPVSITWSLAGKDVTSDPAMSTTQLGGSASFLSIESIGYRHEGNFTCTASNKAGAVSYTAVLRVNGRRRV